jgi:hypothetical protein
MGWTIAYILVLTAVSITTGVSGFGPESWQWWVIIIGVTSAHTFGRAREAKL